MKRPQLNRAALAFALTLACAATPALAAGAIEGGARQPVNPVAITLFLMFVAVSLGVTWWPRHRRRLHLRRDLPRRDGAGLLLRL